MKFGRVAVLASFRLDAGVGDLRAPAFELPRNERGKFFRAARHDLGAELREACDDFGLRERAIHLGVESQDDVARHAGRTHDADPRIPIILAEYGAFRRTGNSNVPLDLATHNNAVDHWITFVTKQALAHGLKPFWWDTGGALDRRNYKVKDQRTIDALNAGGN